MRIRLLVALHTFATLLSAFAVLAGNNPVPFIDQPLVPATATPGGSAFTLTVNGAGFVAGSTVLWNGSARTTTFVSGTRLTAAIPATDIATASTASITVTNPAPGGGASNVALLPVNKSASSVSYSSSSVSTGLPQSTSTVKTVVGDFNGDGKQDLATLNSDSSVSILLGNGDGTFQPPVFYHPIPSGGPNRLVEGIAVGDFNGDGKLDIAVSDQYFDDVQLSVITEIYTMLGNGDGTFGAAIFASHNANGTSGSVLLAADLNADGNLDLLLDCESPSIAGLCVLLGNGDGTFTPGAVVSTPSASASNFTVAIADLNGDGNLDLAVGYVQPNVNAFVAVTLGTGAGTFGTPGGRFGPLTTVDTIPLPTGNFSASIAAADFDGNGIPDLAYYFLSCNSPGPCTGNLQSYSGNGDGTFQSALPSLGAPVGNSNLSNLMVGDFNGDGILDVAVWNTVLLGRGDGTFAANPTPLSQNANIAVDFNNDGFLDFFGETPLGQLFVQLRTPPDFTGFSSPTSETVIAGTNSSYSLQVIPLYGWLNDVTLTVGGLPTGVSAVFQPAVVPSGNGVSLLSIVTSAATTPGTYTLTLTGTAGTISHSTTITLVINPASADFGGDITPATQLVAGGQQANYAVQVVSFNGFTGDVTLGVSGLPPGSLFSFNPPVITGGSGSSVLTVIAPPSARSGAYILSITGTSGSLSHSGARELDVNTNADFTGSVNSVTNSVLPGQRAVYAANVVPLNGFTGTVALSVSGLPAGATARFTPANVMGGSGTSSLIVSTSSTTPTGAYTLTISGASGSDAKSTTVSLLVNSSPGDFTGSISPTAQSVTAGTSANYAVTIFPVSGFTGNVTISVAGLPAGATLSFAPSNMVSGGSGTVNFTITTTGVATGTYTMLVTGTSGGLSHSGSITLTVN